MNMRQPVPDTQTAPDKIDWFSMSAVIVAVLLAILDYAVANIALPTIAHDMRVSDAHSVWVVNAYQLASTVLMLPLAGWAGRMGSRRMCMLGLCVIMTGSVLCAAAQNLPLLVVARLIQGAGGACILAVAGALIRSAYPPALLGRGMALYALIAALGVAISPSVASAILSIANWRWLFLFNLPVGAIGLTLAALFLRGTPPVADKVDWLSNGLCLVAFGCIIVAADMLVHAVLPHVAILLLLAGCAAFWLLLRSQRGIATPLLPVDLMAIRDFRIAFFVCFLGYMGANFFMISIPFTLTTFFHRSVIETGLLITPWPVGMILIAPLIGRLSDRYPAGVLSSIGLFIVGAGYLALRLTPPDAGNLSLMLRLGLAGMGYGFFVAPNNQAMMAASPIERSAGASGMMSMARLMGQTTGATCVALILARFPVHPSLNCLEFGTATLWFAAALSVSRLWGRHPRTWLRPVGRGTS